MAKLLYGNAYTRLIMKEGYEVHSKIIDWGKKFSIDKIPEQALGVDPATAKLMKWALASWQRFEFMAKYLGGTIAPRLQLDLVPALKCSAHFVLYSTGVVPATLEQQLEAGRALQRFWLTAAKLKLGFQPEQTPVIFSTHHLDEVASLCDRVVVIDKGVSAFSGDITQFKALSDNGDLREAFLSVLNGTQQMQQQGAA